MTEQIVEGLMGLDGFALVNSSVLGGVVLFLVQNSGNNGLNHDSEAFEIDQGRVLQMQARNVQAVQNVEIAQVAVDGGVGEAGVLARFLVEMERRLDSVREE